MRIGYLVLGLLFFLLALFALAVFFQYTRKLSKEGEGSGDWYRYVIPTVLAALLAWFGHGFGMGILGDWFFLLLIGIGLPLAAAYVLNTESFQKRSERIVMAIAILMFLSAAAITSRWGWHYRNNGDDWYHITRRNGFVIPLWILTIFVGFVAHYMWKKNNDGNIDDSYFVPDMA